MTVAAGYPRLQQFGSNAGGSTSPVVLIGPTQIPALQAGFSNGNIPFLKTFGASAAEGAAGSYFQLQVSNSNLGPWTEIERIEIPNAGVVNISYPGSGIPICAAGQWFQVTATQSTAARMSSSMFGTATTSDIVNI